MKKLHILVCFLVLCITMPGLAFATNNNIEFSLDFGSGNMTVPGVPGSGDVDSMDMKLMYTHFFKGLETDDTPYGAREFLQHPSMIGGGYNQYVVDIVDDVGDTLDFNVDAIGFGGMYYTSNESNSTGIGLTYISFDTEMVLTVSGIPATVNMDESDIILSLHQYLTEETRIELDYTMADIDRKTVSTISADASLIKLGVSALVDSFWFSGYYETGDIDWPTGYLDDDITGIGVTLGTYINQSTGLFFDYSNRETDDGSSKTDITDISFIGDYYFNERTHIKGTLTLHKEDDPTFMKIEETVIKLAGGFFF